MKLKTNENYKICVYLQSRKYFAHMQDHVRKEHTFKKLIKEFATEKVELFRRHHANVDDIESQKPIVVGVHIQRGDLASEAFIKADRVSLTPNEYIRNAIDFFLAKF